MGRLPWVLDREMRRSAERAQQLVKAELDRIALDQTLQDLHNLVMATDEACIVAVTDAAGKIQRVNAKFCELSGYSPRELLGQDHRIVNSGAHPPEFMRELWKTIGRGQIWRGEIRNRAKNGHHYWVDSTIVPLLGLDGKPQQYIAIRHDITARKAAEARLRDQATLTQLGAMATVVAHEVRNPLAGIGGALQVIGERLPEGARERAIVAGMIERIGALDRTLGDLLEYARPQPPKRRLTDVRGLLDAIAASVQRDPRFAGLEITVTGAPVQAEIDGEMLTSALLNLAINAAIAMAGKGHLHFQATVENDWVLLQVSDTGPGIPKELHEQVFTPFFTTRSRGTGLGLAIVRRVVDQHDGALHLDCPPTGGTVIGLELPLAALVPIEPTASTQIGAAV